MRASLRDVAARAGVSVKTVSNVVNGYAHVSAPTRARVQQALDELDYRPNLSARNLRAGRTGVIALGLPELDMPYFAELASEVIEAGEERGWTVLIDQTEGLPERERFLCAGIRGHLIDGLLLSPLALGHDELARHAGDTPLVLLGERVYGGPADHVAIDNVGAARTATEHVLALGRRRVAAIGAQRGVATRTPHLRHQGFREALAAAGLRAPDAHLPLVDSYHRSEGAAAMAALLATDPRPDAVVCFNDLLALGALRTLHEHGLRVPEDVAVVGVDDIEDGRYATPTLTTIAPDKRHIARSAVDLLHERLTARGAEPREVEAPYRLVVRESTRGRAAAGDRHGGADAPGRGRRRAAVSPRR